jgi:hypothetical protein
MLNALVTPRTTGAKMNALADVLSFEVSSFKRFSIRVIFENKW